MADFADMLARAIENAGYNPTTFAKAVDTSQGRVRDVIERRYKGRAPLNDLARWAVALKLEGKALDDFMWAGLMSHCPAELQDYWRRHHARVDRLEKRVAEFEATKYKP